MEYGQFRKIIGNWDYTKIINRKAVLELSIKYPEICIFWPISLLLLTMPTICPSSATPSEIVCTFLKLQFKHELSAWAVVCNFFKTSAHWKWQNYFKFLTILVHWRIDSFLKNWHASCERIPIPTDWAIIQKWITINTVNVLKWNRQHF